MSRTIFISAAFVIMCSSTPLRAETNEIVVPPQFSVHVLVDGITAPLPKLEAIRNPAYGNGVMAAVVDGGTLTISRVSEAGVEPFAAVPGLPVWNGLADVRFDHTGLLGGMLYVSTSEDPGCSPPQWARARLYRVDADGTVNEVDVLGGCSDQLGFNIDFADGDHGYDSGIYAVDGNKDGGTTWYHWAPDLSRTLLFQNYVPPGRTDLDMHVEFDSTGLYGSYFTVSDCDTNNDAVSAIYSLLPDLSWDVLVEEVSSDTRCLGDMSFSAGGSLGEMLYVIEGITDTIVTVAPDGTLTEFASGFSELHSISISEDGGHLYVIDSEGIYEIRATSGPTIFVNGEAGNDEWDGLCQQWDGGSCGPKATIQAGINAVMSGGEVVIADGIYSGAGNQDLSVIEKPLTIRSENGPDLCVIDCQGEGRGFLVQQCGNDTIIEGLWIRNGLAVRGGGIYLDDTAGLVQNCRLTSNAADYGGAAYISDSSPSLANCLLDGNHASSFGGAINADSGVVTISDCFIASNSAWGGGGLRTRSDAEVSVRRCQIQNNVATVGGGIDAAGVLHASKCIVNGNVAEWGGGLRLGGGHANTRVVACEIRGNVATHIGGGIQHLGGSPRVVDSLVADNSVGYYGGGCGSTGSTLYIYNCTIAGNSSDWFGGGLYGHSNSLSVSNSIIASNSGSYGDEIAADDETWVWLEYSDVLAGDNSIWAAGASYVVFEEGMIGEDPQFVDPLNSDYRLTHESPCVDSGSNALCPLDETDLDEDGDTEELLPQDCDGSFRIARFTVDMGAYEIPYGDLNCDSIMSFDDIAPFTTALGGAGSYEAQFPDCEWLYADCDGDGDVDFDDIWPFVQLLGE